MDYRSRSISITAVDVNKSLMRSRYREGLGAPRRPLVLGDMDGDVVRRRGRFFWLSRLICAAVCRR